MRILLVEDDDVLRRALSHALARHHQVSFARDGEDAIEKLEGSTRFDVVVLDYQLPGIMGAELLDAVQRRSPGTPIIWMTGVPHLVPGYDPNIVEKPAEIDRLLEVIRLVGARA